jgi:DNA-binding FadR family transcriptional regulator
MLKLIHEGRWAPRMKLPSEAELSRRFGMSRPVIRQALARLRKSGHIQSRQGSGSFVCDGAPAARPETHIQFPTIGSLADLQAFLNFREGVEGEAAATAARRHTETQMREMVAASERLANGPAEWGAAESDYEFHLAIAAASNNSFYENTLASLREQMLLGLNLEWSFSGGHTEFRTTVMAQHAAVIEAIGRRDADGARATMRGHLRWGRSRLVTGKDVLQDP